MRNVEFFALKEGFASSYERKKRLGQYFSGEKLGRLLANLAGVTSDNTVLDTMAGSGDLLSSCHELGVAQDALSGIEIDPIAYRECNKRLNKSNCVLGSAFEESSYSNFKSRVWDVVITNPPYVRYQRMSSRAGSDNLLSNATEIRSQLLKILESLSHLDAKDKDIFSTLIKNYSGLSDLAVPSWILNSLLVKEGGVFALVLPESWLSRDYALIVKYILFRWFRIEYIVEDANACWFSEAQVKTTLLIARRIPRKESAFDFNARDTFLKICLFESAKNDNSLVGNLYPNDINPDGLFSINMRQCLLNEHSIHSEMLEVESVPLSHMIIGVKREINHKKWFGLVESHNKEDNSSSVVLPYEVLKWAKGIKENIKFVDLTSLGVRFGQGLRTGANSFYYLDLISCDINFVKVRTSKLTGGGNIRISRDHVMKVVRRQSELPVGYTVFDEKLLGYVLTIEGAALPEDIFASEGLARQEYYPLDAELSEYIRTSESVNFGTESNPKKVVELSSVSTNIRKERKGYAERYWYMLPPMAKRHKPDLFLARVNSSSPKVFLNKDSKAIVDANFSTVWLEDESKLDVYSLLAIMNSTFFGVLLEYSSSVMGGGALKVEATHLKRLSIPEFSENSLVNLSSLGFELSISDNNASSKRIVRRIDEEIVGFIFDEDKVESALICLEELKNRALMKRNKSI
ncbi:TPA: N-6 DNA methylase [Vibrio parahaemolyticus]